MHSPDRTCASKLLIFFHGNGEDIGTSRAIAKHLCHTLNVHVLVPEYPGYGVYRGVPGKKGVKAVTPSAETIIKDALTVFKYFTGDQ